MARCRTADMVSACVTPVYLKGRYVGAWAVTVPMGSYFMRTIKDALHPL